RRIGPPRPAVTLADPLCSGSRAPAARRRPPRAPSSRSVSSTTVHITEPTVDTLRAMVDRFVGGGADRSWLRLREQTTPAVDLALAQHRRAALVWLNAWGCRLRYPRPGEEDVFDAGLARW